MNFYKILSAFTAISMSLICFSCDSGTNPVSSVTGKVYRYSDQPASNVKVTIQDKSTCTLIDGSFMIRDIVFPFDAIAFDSINKSVSIYKNMSTENVVIKLIEGISYMTNTTISVNFPEKIIQSKLNGKIIFTDGNKINVYREILQNSSQADLNLQLNEFTTGKLLFLTYRKDSTGIISSYENYGESSDITVQPNGSYSYTFDSLSIALNPGEQDVNGSFILPPEYTSNYSYYYLTFTPNIIPVQYYFSYWFSNIGNNYFNFKIPTGIPRQFSIIAENYSSRNPGNSMESYVVNPGSSNNLEVKSFPVLVSPDDFKNNVSMSDQFFFQGGSGSGVYMINIHNDLHYGDYFIVTTENTFTLESLNDAGVGSLNNSHFSWSVHKLGPSSSMNDFVSNNYINGNYFNLYSGVRFFSTAL